MLPETQPRRFVVQSMPSSASKSASSAFRQIECDGYGIAYLCPLPLRRVDKDPVHNLPGLCLLLTERVPEPTGC